MINSVYNIEIKKNPFEDVSGRTSSPKYWLESSQNKNDAQIYAGAFSLPEIISPEEARRTNNKAALGISIGTVTLLAAASIFFILKGGPKGFANYFRGLRSEIDKRLQQSKMDIQSNPTATKILTFSLNGIDKFLNKAEAVNNFTTIKDLLFKKTMNLSRITGGLHEKITQIFSKIARNAVKSSYSETFAKFKETMGIAKVMDSKIYGEKLDEIIEINGVKKSRKLWLSQIDSMNTDLLLTYRNFFGRGAQLSRLKNYKYSLRHLEDKFKEKGALWFMSKDTLNRFVADGLIADDKEALHKAIKTGKKIISYSRADVLKEADEQIFELIKLFNYKDIKNISSLKDILKNIEKYALANKNDSAKILDSILADIKTLKYNVSTSVLVKSEDISKICKGLDVIAGRLKNYKPGKMEDILQIYKALLSKEDYQKLEKAYKGNIVALDKSIKKESEDYLNKLRDLTLGSAPTDVLTMVTGVGTLGYYLLKSEDNRERTAISLKYGIPALVGIGTMLYGNAKLFAGSKSLLFGTISMWLTNRFGDIATSILENHWEKSDKSKSQQAS